MAHAVVAGALLRERRVLLGHRSVGRHSYPDCWDLPGGHVEPGESRERALVRELREELGIAAVVEGDPVLHLEERPDHDDGLVMDVWPVSRWRGMVTNQAPEEHDDLRWFASEELGALVLAHPGSVVLLIELLAAHR